MVSAAESEISLARSLVRAATDWQMLAIVGAVFALAIWC